MVQFLHWAITSSIKYTYKHQTSFLQFIVCVQLKDKTILRLNLLRLFVCRKRIIVSMTYQYCYTTRLQIIAVFRIFWNVVLYVINKLKFC